MYLQGWTNMADQELFEFEQREPIRGYPELRWEGKRPYTSTQYYPAQCKETHGEAAEGWMNRLYWGDNLQVMSHLIKEFRGAIDLIYIDPPFDSKADYKKKIEVKGQTVQNDNNSFEEKQYSDIWTNDSYLQFMYERLVLMRELLSNKGSIYLHCDWHKGHHLRMLMDEVFGPDNFVNEISWCYGGGGAPDNFYPRKHDNLFWYARSKEWCFNKQYRPYTEGTLQRGLTAVKGDYELSIEGAGLDDWWADKPVQKILSPTAYENLKYPTQKPEGLLKRIITGHSNPGDIVFDCFMGSGTTQAVAMKLGRRFIGADINLGAIQTTTKRLLGIAKELNSNLNTEAAYTGFEVYNVNNYDFFRNPVEAKELLIDFFEIQPSTGTKAFDGEKDGRMIKIMPVDRICCRADLEGFLSLLPYKAWKKKLDEHPEGVTEKISLYCMGHEPDLRGILQKELSQWNVDVEVFDILREKRDLELKRDSEADITIYKGKIIIRKFYPMNLMQKLSLQKTAVKNDWRVLVESVMIDFNYDGAVLHPAITDIPAKNELVKGEYKIPENAGTIRVKITDLLSESLEVELENG